MTGLRQIEPDELPALAIGTGVLGTGGGTHPYAVLNRLGDGQYRAQSKYQSKRWNFSPETLYKFLSD